MRVPKLRFVLAASITAVLTSAASAEEGFWPFSRLPVERMRSDIGMVPRGDVLDKVERATLQLGGFCTASLAGPDGLFLTNFHCIADCLKDVSRPEEDLVANGFMQKDSDAERQCPGLFAERPVSDLDVTDRFSAVLKGLSGSAYSDRLNQEIGVATGECQSGDETRSCRIVQYFDGAVFRLQAFKIYRDIRVVFAPEYASANFGGDPDNFNFPRFGFDMALLRLYENGSPAQAEGWLTWRDTPPKEGEPVIVAGYPSFTFRHFTVAQLRSMRDGFLPWYMSILAELRGRLIQFAVQQPGASAAAASMLYRIENSYKAARGEFGTLADENVMSAKEAAEASLQAKIAADPVLASSVGTAFEEIAAAERVYREIYWKYTLRRDLAPSVLFEKASDLVTAIRQLAKPEGERLPDYVDENLPSIEASLFAEIKVDRDLEVLALSFGLSKLREHLGTDHPFVRKVLGRESPESLARRAIAGTGLLDVEFRKKLLSGGAAALASSNDSLLGLAAIVGEEYAALDRRFKEEVETPQSLAQQRLSSARDAGNDQSRYPDADGSLRLSYGRVSGWREADGRDIPACTTVKGLSERASDSVPFELAKSWKQSLDKVDDEEPFNCVTTHDVVGGYSGSAVIDMDGRIVGLMFDGNLPSLGGTYIYDGARNRAIMLSARLIREGLRNIYQVELLDR